MKTTIDIPEELLVRAKKRAAELRKPLRALVTDGLRDQLAARSGKASKHGSSRPIRWVTVPGGLPADLDVTDRSKMHDWIRRRR
jgi:hypothetical protein